MKDIIFETKDMRYLDWAVRKMSSGTAGCFLKAYEEVSGERLYYKLSNYDSYRGVFGHECINELIVSRIMDLLEIPHVTYQLIHAMVEIDNKEIETWISVSKNFRKPDEEKMAFDMYYDMQKKSNESPLDFAIRNGWERYIYQMFCSDFLVANRDRHGSNLEVLCNKKNGTVRLAPFFDQGVSLLFSAYGDEKQAANIDVMQDFAANNFIGSRSLAYNLSLIPADYDLQIKTLQESDKKGIFDGISEILSDHYIEKIWEMIWKRWCYFEALRGKKQ